MVQDKTIKVELESDVQNVSIAVSGSSMCGF